MANVFNRQTLKTLGILGFCAALLLGCRAVAAPTPTPTEQAAALATAMHEAMPTLQLAGTSWQMESFGDPPDELFPLQTVQPTLTFFLQRYGGYGGCNWFLGIYSVDETNMRLLTPAETRVICTEPGVMQQELTFISALRNILFYAIEGERLVGFNSVNQRLLTLVPAEMAPLEETTWQAALVAQDVLRPVSVIPGSEITLTISGDEISGSAGCNTYTAPATLREGDVTIGALVSTRMACSEPQGIMQQEQRFLNVLQSVESFEQGASTLVMYNADGEPAILFGARVTVE